MSFVTYAQNLEDVMLWRAFRNIENGFYVDVGASDPNIYSVTRAFYDRGWHGINIEPEHSSYDQLSSARSRDINIQVAAAETTGELTFFEIPETGLSTLDPSVAEMEGAAGWPVIEKKVATQTLNEIFEQYVTGPIHFLKIDVEGAEGSVLKGLNLMRWRPWIMVIEATIPMSTELNHESWEPLVLAADYRFAYFDGLNRFYVAEEHSGLAEFLKIPPNIFDDYLNVDLRDARDKLKGVLAERDQFKAELNVIYNSRSYRITAPLRSGLGFARGLKSRLAPLKFKSTATVSYKQKRNVGGVESDKTVYIQAGNQLLNLNDVMERIRAEAAMRNADDERQDSANPSFLLKSRSMLSQQETVLFKFIKQVQFLFQKLPFYQWVYRFALKFKRWIPKYQTPGLSFAELIEYEDEDFIKVAYNSILKREPDNAGFDLFLSKLRSGSLNKADILAKLRYSAEGNRAAVKIKGLSFGQYIASFFRR